MNTKDKGELSEARFIVKFLEMGYICSKPFGDNSAYDLIIDDRISLFKVQIKTGRVRNNSLLFNAVSCSRYVHRKYTNLEVDIYAVYEPEADKYYLIPFKDVTANKPQLTLNEVAKVNQRRAKDYEV